MKIGREGLGTRVGGRSWEGSCEEEAWNEGGREGLGAKVGREGLGMRVGGRDWEQG